MQVFAKSCSWTKIDNQELPLVGKDRASAAQHLPLLASQGEKFKSVPQSFAITNNSSQLQRAAGNRNFERHYIF